MKTPLVNFTIVDESTHAPVHSGSAVVLTKVTNAVVNMPVFIGTRIMPIRWWQFWRWHLIFKRRREIILSKRKFDEFLGSPKIIAGSAFFTDKNVQ